MGIIEEAGNKLLAELIYCYKHNIDYYLSERIPYLFEREDDALFTPYELIFDYVAKILSDDYKLVIEQVQRLYESEEHEDHKKLEDFIYEDTLIRLEEK